MFVANDGNNALYLNEGGGGFTKITDGDITIDGGDSYGCTWVDYNQDSHVDLFVANSGDNFLYTNKGDGTFTKVTDGAIVNDASNSQGGSWADLDNDGDFDLFVANIGNNALYRNNGDSTFTQVVADSVVLDGGASIGGAWGDFDNDGDLDLFVANADGQNNFLYANDGNGNFTKCKLGEIVTDGGNSAGVSWADFNGDGQLDLFVANKDGNNFLYFNHGNNNHWTSIVLEGIQSNAAGIGAEVSVLAKVSGAPVWQTRHISAQTGFGGQNSLSADFGLGDAILLEIVRIEWPSGKVQELPYCPVDMPIRISEELKYQYILTPVNPNLYAKNHTGKQEGCLYWYFTLTDSDSNEVQIWDLQVTLENDRGTRIQPRDSVMADGEIRLRVDMNSTGLAPGDSASFEFADIIVVNGRKAELISKPEPLVLHLQDRSFPQSWDLFASKSLGASGIVGGEGAGASAAAAKLSVIGEGGTGMTILLEDNFDNISRRFQLSVKTELAVPSTNLVVKDVINTGAKASVKLIGLYGQKVRFDSDDKSDEALMSKAGYILETLSLSGVHVSPTFGLFRDALITTLLFLSGVDFEPYLIEELYGAGVELERSVKIGLELGENSPLSFTLVGLGDKRALHALYVEGRPTPANNKFGIKLAHEFDAKLLSLGLADFKMKGDDAKITNPLPDLTFFAAGAGHSLEFITEFDPANAPVRFQIDYENGIDLKLVKDLINKTYLTRITVPTKILVQLLTDTSTEILKITGAYADQSTKIPIETRPDSLVRDLSNILKAASGAFNTEEEPVTLQVFKRQGTPFDLSIGIELDAALGVGVGLILGFDFHYYSNIDFLRKRGVLLGANQLYLLESTPENVSLKDDDELDEFLDETVSGTVLLVKEALNNIVEFVEFVVGELEKFAKQILNKATRPVAKVGGAFKNAGRVLVRTFSPDTRRVLSPPFQPPYVKEIYTSHRIAYRRPNGSLLRAPESATLILVSDNVNLNFEEEGGDIPNEFDTPVSFSMIVDEEQLIDNGFSVVDKDKIRIYHYDDSTSTWLRIEEDVNAHLDTVAAAITMTGNYALGIELRPEDDVEPPLLNEVLPEDGSTVSPNPLLQAKITDQVNGSGVDVANCKLILDGVELETYWKPTEEILFQVVKESLARGEHTLKVIGADFNNNVDSVVVTFDVGDVTNIDEDSAPKTFEVFSNYPNPFNGETKIKYRLPNAGEVEVNIYDISGRYVKSILNEFQSAGEKVTTWDGTDNEGRVVASGVYFYQIKYRDFNLVKRMTFVK